MFTLSLRREIEGRMKYSNFSVRAEAVERAALADLHRAASEEARTRLGLSIRVVDGVLVSMARETPTIVVNRAVGLGMAHPADRETVDAVVDHYRQAGVQRYFLHLDPGAAPDDLPRWLEASGLAPYHRAWAKFRRGAEPAPDADSDLQVRKIGPEHAFDFGRIATAGFELDEAWIPVLAGLVGREHWHVYMSFDGDTPAGCGAMRIHGGLAWFDWAATLPEYRRLGSQGAVLSTRIADGIALGCDEFTTATGEEVEGDPQHSYRNIERFGFRRTHARANWVPC
jgi:hypothetical protein